MNLLRNFFARKICTNNLTALPTNLNVLFEKLKILITNNILDISLIKEIVFLITNELHESKQNEEYTQSDLFLILRKEIKRFYIKLKNEMKSEFNLTRYYQILNFTIFLYIFCLNMKTLYNIDISEDIVIVESNKIQIASTLNKNFYEIFFEKNCMFISTLLKLVKYIKETTDSQNELFKLISNFFSDEGEIFRIFEDPKLNLKDSFIRNKSLFKSVIPEMDELEFKKSSMNDVTDSIYKKVLEDFLNIEINYDTIFNKNFICLNEDKPLIKSMLCQAILRVVFSKEKYKFLNKNSSYEINFLQNLSKKCISFYFEKFGDNVNCLFRREEIYDDLIKNIFFTFGNNFYLKCFYTSIKKLIDKYSAKDEMNYPTQDEFLFFYEDLLQKIKIFIPPHFRILLKLIYDNVLTIYEGKISKDNFSPILTILFFNFFISPKMQEFYNISPIKYSLVKNINRLIRNICFNEKFKEGDDMKYFNEMIEICHLHTRSTIDKLINSFVVDDIDYILKNEIEKSTKALSFPTALFYYDCDYVINLLECSTQDENEIDLSNEKILIEKIMSAKRNSFVIKFDYNDLKKLKILKGRDSQEITVEEEDISDKSEEDDLDEEAVSKTEVEPNKDLDLTPNSIKESACGYASDDSFENRKEYVSRSYTVAKRGTNVINRCSQPINQIDKGENVKIEDIVKLESEVGRAYRDSLTSKEKVVVLVNTEFNIDTDYFEIEKNKLKDQNKET